MCVWNETEKRDEPPQPTTQPTTRQFNTQTTYVIKYEIETDAVMYKYAHYINVHVA